ncbi:MAG: DNA polymerase III subunit gamma/tau [Bacteroidales bacterium]
MEKFIVSARKYRPTTFADVVGQPSIATTLKNSIINNHLGHAYLFSGPRGVGKTTCARIFAKTINCFHITESGEACNECESCLSFKENRSYNIHELDAASNNSVEDIRTLNEQVRIPPQIGSHSVYIIDEVHMLSQSAFNAFLKTLEEPPAHAIFVLATTEKHKIIPTILSRCQIFDFNRIRVEDAVDYLKQIAGKESIAYEEDALHVIAQKADGSMRDALSIFDQVVSFSGEKITYHAVIENLNILDYEYFFRLTDACLEGDVSASLLLFNEVLMKGFDARNFINGYAKHLRDLMVCKDPETIQLMEVGAGIREKYGSQSANVPLSFLYDGLDICNQADIQFRTSRNQRLTIELALVKLAGLAGVQKKKELAPEPASSAAPSLDKTDEKQVEKPSTDLEIADNSGPSAVPNGDSSVVRRPSISIRESLHGALRQSGEVSAGPISNQGKKEEQEIREGPEGKETQSDMITAVEPDQILDAWKAFASSVEKSQPRIHATLINNLPEIKPDGTLQITLNSEAQCENFVKNIKHPLTAYLARATGSGSFEIETRIQEAASNGKRMYTEQDKLDYLMKKNPELGKLKSRFNLDFDD